MKKTASLGFLLFTVLLLHPATAKAQVKKEIFGWVASAINSYSWANQYTACKDANGTDYVKRVEIIADTALMEITAKVQTSFIAGSSSYVETQNNFKNLVAAEICDRCLSCGADVPIKLVFKKNTMKVLKLEGAVAVPDVMFLFLRWDAEPDLKDKMVKSLNQLVAAK